MRHIDTTTREKAIEQRDRAILIAQKHKARESTIVRGLGAVQEAVASGKLNRVTLAIDALMGTDLKEAREDVYNRDAALRIAVEAMKTEFGAGAGKAMGRALDEVRALVPSVFETPVPVAGEASA